MELLNADLTPGFQFVHNSHNMRSFQSWTLCHTFKKIDLPYKICAVNNTACLRHCDEVEITEESIDRINASTVDIVLYLNCDHIHEKSIRDMELLALCKKTVIVIDHAVSNKINLTNYPTIVYHMWATFMVQVNETTPSLLKNQRNYIFSSLINKARYERIANIVEFEKAGYYNNRSLVTFNLLEEKWWSSRQQLWLSNMYPEMYNWFVNNMIPKIPFRTTDDISLYDGSWQGLFSYENSAYTDAYVNVCCETNYGNPFLSEKIFKPMLTNQLCIAVGGQGMMSMLNNLGFDTFDDIIDHSRYDNSETNTRVADVHKVLSEIQHYDWPSIYQATEARREYNRQKLLNFDIEQKFLQELRALIN